MKYIVYKVCVRSAMFYGADRSDMKIDHIDMLETTQMRMCEKHPVDVSKISKWQDQK